MQRLKLSFVVSLSWAFFTLTAATLATGQQLNYKTIGVPGALQTWVNGINDSGTIVGSYVTSPNGHPSNGFMLSGGIVTTLNDPNADPNGDGTICYGINNLGEVVGGYISVAGWRAFLYDAGVYTDILPPGSSFSVAYGINGAGEVVGWFEDQYGHSNAFLFDGASFRTLNVPGAQSTVTAGGINNKDDITLQWVDQLSATHNSIYNGSTYTLVDYPGVGGIQFASSINDAGDVTITVGTGEYYSYDYGILRRADGTFLHITPPQGRGGHTTAPGINNSGVVVGTAALSIGFEAR